MRLIDADEFAIEEPKLWDWSSVDGISSTAILKQCIWDVQCAPTVKAIPIEWLHSIMKKQLIFAMESEMEGTTTVKDGVIHCVSGALACQVLANVIELWEKENETNRQR